jgi:hypothetical protein
MRDGADVQLFTAAGILVDTVRVNTSDDGKLPDVILLGDNIYALRDGVYREAIVADGHSLASP